MSKLFLTQGHSTYPIRIILFFFAGKPTSQGSYCQTIDTKAPLTAPLLQEARTPYTSCYGHCISVPNLYRDRLRPVIRTNNFLSGPNRIACANARGCPTAYRSILSRNSPVPPSKTKILSTSFETSTPRETCDVEVAVRTEDQTFRTVEVVDGVALNEHIDEALSPGGSAIPSHFAYFLKCRRRRHIASCLDR